MGNPCSLIVAALVACLTQQAVPRAAAQDRQSDAQRVTQIAAVTTGTIDGTVQDERGTPLDGVVVSALGGGTGFAVTDGTGKFRLRALPPGPYLVRAHLQGYLPARQVMVNVRPSTRTTSTFKLRREGTAAEPRVAAAGMAGTGIDALPPTERGRDESETAWRLRHLRRPVLKDAHSAFLVPADEDRFRNEGLFGRAVESSARLASALFSDFPVQGQVNLLTTGSFDNPAQLLELSRTTSVAFFSVGAPVSDHGDWRVRAALNQGDLSSWILSGNYTTRTPATHRYTMGMSYGLQRYEGGNAMALAAVPDAARNVGSISAYDDWTVSRHLMVSGGATYAHHDYLQGPGLFSPRLSVTLSPTAKTRIRTSVSRHLSAPGGDEFVPPSRAEFVPPQRTFSPLSNDGFRTQGVRHYEVAVERTLAHATLAARVFHQAVDNQLVTVFGLRTPESPESDLGHYFVGSAGNVAVDGWGLTFTHALSDHLRSSIDYSQSRAAWQQNAPLGDRIVLAEWVPSAVRPRHERIHDLTTSFEAESAPTATRLVVLYKWSNAFLAADQRAFDARFDVQISQSLPFMNFLRAEWEALVAVRNVFRENITDASIYDELLVARPPKRLVGGLTVRF